MDAIVYNISKACSIALGAFKGNSVHVYWWNTKVNFGDLLTPELLRHFGRTPIHRYPASHSTADWIAVGSLIQMLPPSYCGNILGSGLIKDTPYELANARIWSVRGELTKRAMRLPESTPTGDLGLLADRLLQGCIGKTHSIGLVPHYVDKQTDWVRRFSKKYADTVLIIDVERPAHEVIRDIARCRTIASSSLHGLVVADSLSIPSVWVNISDDVIGDGFKFHDYFSSLGVRQECVSHLEINNPRDVEQRSSLRSTDTVIRKKAEIESLLIKAMRLDL